MKYSIGIAVFVSLAVFLDAGEQLGTFEKKTVDARHGFYARPTSHTSDIIILEITEEAIKRFEPFYGRWPWPRSIHGEVVEYLSSDGAAAVGFDIVFSEQSMRQEVDSAVIDELAVLAKNTDVPEIREELLRRLGAMRPGASDREFAAAVKASGRVFQSSVFYTDGNDLAKYPDLGADETAALKIKTALSRSAVSLPPRDRRNTYFNATVPFPELAAASRGIGHINVIPDSDGIYRRFNPLLWFRDGDAAYPSLALAIAAHLKGIPLDAVRLRNDSLILGDVKIPMLSDGSAMINYQGGRITRERGGQNKYESFYQYVPYELVIASRDLIQAGRKPALPKGAFKGKIVLITASAAGITDLRATPFSPVTPGVEIHANIIDNILSKKFLRRVGEWEEKIYILFLALIIGITASISRPSGGFAITAALIASVAGLHWKLFDLGWVLPIVSPAMAMTGTYLGVLLLKYISEEREKKQIRTAFGHYLAPQVLEEVLKSPGKLKLGGERRHMTVLFSDIEGFTSLSEHLPPEEISSILNEYLGQMMDCIKKTEGTLDKFIGDAVMAEWNAPVAQEDHAARACETALLMMEGLGRLKEKWEKEQKPRLNARIGINSGEMVVGNMGSKEIFDYTVIGNEVNTSARLEPLNKDFGTNIIVSESTRLEAERSAAGKFVFRLLAKVALKGRAVPLTVYELAGRSNNIGKEHLKAIELYDEGFALFLKAGFSDAKRLFLMAVEKYPEDGLSKKYISLCEYYEGNPPDSDWDGIYKQTSK